MIKRYIDVNDVIHENEHTMYANCGLHVNIRLFVNVILFYDKKGSH